MVQTSAAYHVVLCCYSPVYGIQFGCVGCSWVHCPFFFPEVFGTIMQNFEPNYLICWLWSEAISTLLHLLLQTMYPDLLRLWWLLNIQPQRLSHYEWLKNLPDELTTEKYLLLLLSSRRPFGSYWYSTLHFETRGSACFYHCCLQPWAYRAPKAAKTFPLRTFPTIYVQRL